MNLSFPKLYFHEASEKLGSSVPACTGPSRVAAAVNGCAWDHCNAFLELLDPALAD